MKGHRKEGIMPATKKAVTIESITQLRQTVEHDLKLAILKARQQDPEMMDVMLSDAQMSMDLLGEQLSVMAGE